MIFLLPNAGFHFPPQLCFFHCYLFILNMYVYVMCRVCACVFMCVSCECECRRVCASAHIGSEDKLGCVSSPWILFQTGSLVHRWVKQANWPVNLREFCLWCPSCSGSPGVADVYYDTQLFLGRPMCNLILVQQAFYPQSHHPKPLFLYLCIWLILSSFRWAIKYRREFEKSQLRLFVV